MDYLTLVLLNTVILLNLFLAAASVRISHTTMGLILITIHSAGAAIGIAMLIESLTK